MLCEGMFDLAFEIMLCASYICFTFCEYSNSSSFQKEKGFENLKNSSKKFLSYVSSSEEANWNVYETSDSKPRISGSNLETRSRIIIIIMHGGIIISP